MLLWGCFLEIAQIRKRKPFIRFKTKQGGKAKMAKIIWNAGEDEVTGEPQTLVVSTTKKERELLASGHFHQGMSVVGYGEEKAYCFPHPDSYGHPERQRRRIREFAQGLANLGGGQVVEVAGE